MQLENQEGDCLGFVVMSGHAVAFVHFPEKGRPSTFMNQWKHRSSMELKRLYKTRLSACSGSIGPDGSLWQPEHYVSNVYSQDKTMGKLDYMHNNPVKAGLVKKPVDRPYSPARWYFLKRPVGVDIHEITTVRLIFKNFISDNLAFLGELCPARNSAPSLGSLQEGKPADRKIEPLTIY